MSTNNARLVRCFAEDCLLAPATALVKALGAYTHDRGWMGGEAEALATVLHYVDYAAAARKHGWVPVEDYMSSEGPAGAVLPGDTQFVRADSFASGATAVSAAAGWKQLCEEFQINTKENTEAVTEFWLVTARAGELLAKCGELVCHVYDVTIWGRRAVRVPAQDDPVFTYLFECAGKPGAGLPEN